MIRYTLGLIVTMVALHVYAMGPQQPQQPYYGTAVAMQALAHVQIPHMQSIVVSPVPYNPAGYYPIHYSFNYPMPMPVMLPYNSVMYSGFPAHDPRFYTGVPGYNPIGYPSVYYTPPLNSQSPMPVAAPAPSSIVAQQLVAAPAPAQALPAHRASAESACAQGAAQAVALEYAQSDPEHQSSAKSERERKEEQREKRKARLLDGDKYLPRYNCQECGKNFDTSSKRKSHFNTYHKEKKYVCTYDKKVCNKKFLYAKDLENHIRIHKGEKPFVCQICSTGFTHPNTRDEHKKNEHGMG